ncbi:MAG: nicotinamide-nucleotide amidohydrolase family protein [Clostridia bacterium]|jgi:PncC family amidohydrolase|nr:nicotinamide-nucleotide amidohydrolase family protein [Clostridia bacterium]MDH7572575.1 nicotinamide-nucleotide amidohydrolase family protein [Clostridia bacterium]
MTVAEELVAPLALAQTAGRLLREQGLAVATAESATGGLIAALITEVPGSSDYFRGGVVAYANDVKVGVLGVSPVVLAEQGAVSPQVGREMAEGVRRLLRADIGLADTGIAGPAGATETKPVGLFYLGMATPEGTQVQELRLEGDRHQNRQAAALAALAWLVAYLEGRGRAGPS